MEERIRNIWFTKNEICMETEKGDCFRQPLEAFPTLFYATQEQREGYYIWADNTSIRWERLDEDIHISNFFEPVTVDYNNTVNHLLSKFPYLDIKAFAGYIDMNWVKLAKFRFGVWTPSPETLQKIKNGIINIGKEMTAVAI